MEFGLEIPQNSDSHIGTSKLLSPVYLFTILALTSLFVVVLAVVVYFVTRRFCPKPDPKQKEVEMPYFPPGMLYSESDPFNHRNQVCPICLDGFVPESLVQLLECYHVYHTECAQRWLSEQKVVTLTQICQICAEKKPGDALNQSADLKTTQILLDESNISVNVV